MLPPTLAERLRGLTAAPICDYYGLTETCGGCLFVRPGEQGLARGTIGRPRGVIAQIVNEQGELVPGQGVGELRIYSENVMSGYYREPELTRAILRDGWLYTGDLVSRRSDGRLILHGRKRDVIKDARGDLIYLGEIEAALERDAGVAEAAVCSYRDPQEEEQLAAFVRARPGIVQESELVNRLRHMLLASLGARKVPQRIVVVADFPRCGNQKVDKAQLVGGLPCHGDV
jgi:acyl-coenzyme A synthetase/AMP-(fatty) acid ligase